MITFLFCLFILISNTLYSETINSSYGPLPLYEIGAGFFYAHFPDYPGASHDRTLILPFPSAIYRGDILQAKKDEGVRGRFFNNKRFELDLSFDGTLPSDNKDNPERKDMPKLDTLIEFGPKVRLKILEIKDGFKTNFNFNIALRYALSGDTHDVYGRGFSLNPFFELKFSDLIKRESILLTTLNFKFANEALMHYYYGVDEQYQTQTRPGYKARSGLMESSLATLIYFPFKYDIWFFCGIIEAFYQKTANQDSPLHVRDNSTSIMVGTYWNFHKSDILVYEN